jgi:hypothetical protein
MKCGVRRHTSHHLQLLPAKTSGRIKFVEKSFPPKQAGEFNLRKISRQNKRANLI